MPPRMHAPATRSRGIKPWEDGHACYMPPRCTHQQQGLGASKPGKMATLATCHPVCTSSHCHQGAGSIVIRVQVPVTTTPTQDLGTSGVWGPVVLRQNADCLQMQPCPTTSPACLSSPRPWHSMGSTGTEVCCHCTWPPGMGSTGSTCSVGSTGSTGSACSMGSTGGTGMEACCHQVMAPSTTSSHPCHHTQAI